jgi:hypothetical protein
MIYLNHQAVPLLKNNKDNFSNKSGAVGGNSVTNNSFLPSFYNFAEKPEDPFEFVNEIYLKVIKVKEMQRKVKEIHRVFNENCSHSIGFPTNSVAAANSKKSSASSISFPKFRANLSSSSPATINPHEIKKEEIAGFKAKVCETCMELVIETQYSIDVNGKSPKVVTRNSHICIVSKVRSKTLTLESRTRQAFETLAKSVAVPWKLREEVKRWTDKDGQNNTYLVGFKLPLAKVNSNNIIDIYLHPVKDKMSNTLNNSNLYANVSNNEKGKHHWALGAIKNGQMILNDDELLEFLKTANNRISGYFRIHTSNQEDSSDLDNADCAPEIYCLFVNKGSLK